MLWPDQDLAVYRDDARRWLGRYGPGIALAGGIALAAWLAQQLETWLTGHTLLEALVLAILLGMAARAWAPLPAYVTPGISFTAKQVLETAIVLLGASVDLPAALRAGPGLMLGVALVVAIALAASAALGRLIGLTPKLAILVAVGNSICGNSAIAAVAPVIEATPDDIASAIALTAVLGVALVLGLPLLIPLLRLTLYQYGVVAGLTVYAVPQVVAATFPVSVISGKMGTLVKLVRVMLLGPVVLFFSLRARREGSAARFSLTRYIPWFITGFALCAAARSLGILPASLATALWALSGLLTIAAMAALGLGVDLRAVRQAGARVSVVVILSLLVLLTLSLALVRLLRLGA
jgi:uncharacterized integral membrane protein (TIGR00698 family)